MKKSFAERMGRNCREDVRFVVTPWHYEDCHLLGHNAVMSGRYIRVLEEISFNILEIVLSRKALKRKYKPICRYTQVLRVYIYMCVCVCVCVCV